MAALILTAAAVAYLAMELVGGATESSAKTKKSKVRNPGHLVVATQGYTLSNVDDRQRMTVSCPGSKEPYGGGFLTNPAPGNDGQGVYPNSY